MVFGGVVFGGLFLRFFLIQNNYIQNAGNKHRKTLDLFHRLSSHSTISHPVQLCLYHTPKAKNNCVEISKLVQSHKQEAALKYRGLAENKERQRRKGSLAHERQDKPDTENQVAATAQAL